MSRAARYVRTQAGVSEKRLPLFPMNTTTELEAVNVVLRHIQRAPVNTLTGPSSSDAAQAYATLREMNRELQSKGWEFNTDRIVTLGRDLNNEVPVPANAVHINIERLKYTDIRPVQHGNRMYDSLNQTYIFDRDLEASSVVRLLDWDLLPETARRYITIRAARAYAKRSKMVASLHSMTDDDELRAWMDFLNEWESDRDLNAGAAPDVAELLRRN